MTRYLISKDDIAHNLEQVRGRLGEETLIAVVKGNGYGLGLIPFSETLASLGVDFFAVTEVEDALKLRAALPSSEILMLRSTAMAEELSPLIQNNIILTLGSSLALQRANAVAVEHGVKARFHLKFDLGMGRYGFSPDAVESVCEEVSHLSALTLCGTYAHLNQAFGSLKKTRAQIATFSNVEDRMIECGVEPGLCHLYNSSALFRLPELYGGGARVGSALIGRIAKGGRSLKPVGELQTAVHEPHTLEAGATVGYGAACKLKKPTRVAVLPVGYFHGFGVEKIRDTYRVRDGIRYLLQDILRLLKQKTPFVRIAGKRVKTLGHIGMLHCVVDLSHVPASEGDVAIIPVSPLYLNEQVPRIYL